jgi:hypothetical protein
MAVEAVICEPVSERPFPVCRENTGKVPSFGLTGERTREFWHVDQLLGRPFP